jgi:hypothetical protein
MYDLNGEGDCFLLRFIDDEDNPVHILIDCGIFYLTSNGKQRLNQIADDIVATTGNHLNILIITHEHYDHLAGFGFAKNKFKNMDIDEIWLAWTENTEGDELAESMYKKYEEVHQAMMAVTEKLKAAKDPWIQSINDVLSYSKNVNKLMNTVHKELSDNPPRYCYPKDPPITLPKVENLRFYVLGPPRDEDKIRSFASEKAIYGRPLMIDEVTSFASAVLSSFGKDKLTPEERLQNRHLVERSKPFDEDHGLEKKDALNLLINNELFFETYYGPDDPDKRWRHIENDWLGSAGTLAIQLDSYTNNTSLVLAIEMLDTGKILLFTGDAEEANWDSWKELEWTINNSDNETDKLTGLDIVTQTAFYKVGHHGSVNGTLVDYLKNMRDDLVVMIPVNQKWAKEKKGWEHPGKALYCEIKTKTSGRIIRADNRITEEKPPNLSQEQWEAFKSNISGATKAENDLWIEYKFQ